MQERILKGLHNKYENLSFGEWQFFLCLLPRPQSGIFRLHQVQAGRG